MRAASTVTQCWPAGQTLDGRQPQAGLPAQAAGMSAQNVVGSGAMQQALWQQPCPPSTAQETPPTQQFAVQDGGIALQTSSLPVQLRSGCTQSCVFVQLTDCPGRRQPPPPAPDPPPRPPVPLAPPSAPPPPPLPVVPPAAPPRPPLPVVPPPPPPPPPDPEPPVTPPAPAAPPTPLASLVAFEPLQPQTPRAATSRPRPNPDIPVAERARMVASGVHRHTEPLEPLRSRPDA
jgi:hypothetical protein